MIFVAILVVAFALGFLCWLFLEKFECFALYMITGVIAVILAFIGVFMGVDYVCDCADYTADCYSVTTTRAMYIDELEKYDEMRDTDVTASSTYLELREKVIAFNTAIERARSLESPWLKCVFYEPEYLTIEPIEIGVG